MVEHRAISLLFALLAIWALLLVITPLFEPPGTIDLGDDGVVGGWEHSAAIGSIGNPVARVVYQTGDANCHQKDSRSLFLNGNQMPYCARCTSLFFAMPLGALIFFAAQRQVNPLWIILALVPLGIDGGLQLVTGYESNNVLRIITGGIAGGAMGYVLGVLANEISIIWRSRKPRPREPPGPSP